METLMNLEFKVRGLAINKDKEIQKKIKKFKI